MSANQDLIRACLLLRNTAPEEYALFLKAFAARTTQTTEDLTAAPTDQILVAQGRAQQCIALLQLFTGTEKRTPAP